MKYLLAALLGVLMMTGLATAQSIVGSAHDLSSGTGIAEYKSTTEDEICIFCHTPHNATTVQAPLWNRSNPTTSYDTYWSNTMDADSTEAATVDGISLVCLSCHDGSMGVNAIASADPDPTMTKTLIDGSALMGSDLSNDHPVSFVYATAQASDAGLKDVAYYLDDSGKVQCSSCHDVHNPGSGSSAPFLRESNSGSALCLECHDK